MNKRLSGKITFVAGGAGLPGAGIVRSFLQEDATVIVPVKSARSLALLKDYLGDTGSGRLVTLLTDYPDYDKAFEVAESIVEAYGPINLAVAAFDSPPASSCLTELTISDWQKMADENMTAGFVVGRVILQMMKASGQGMYISMSRTKDFEKTACSALANIAAVLQVELARIFAQEIQATGVRYHHLLIGQLATPIKQGIDKGSLLTPEAVGDFIVGLYNGKTGRPGQLFQWPAGKKTTGFLPVAPVAGLLPGEN